MSAQSAPIEARALRWGPERFYWAVLEAPGVRRGGVVPEGLRPALEDEVPASAGELHAVGVPAGEGRLIVCALPRETLDALDPDLLSLKPSALPECVGVSADPGALELLVGPHEPAAFRRRRARTHTAAAATLLLCSLLLALGLWRRAERWDEDAAALRRERAALLAELAPGGAELALDRELQRMRGAAGVSAQLRPPEDAGLALAKLLAAWPAGVPSRPQGLVVTPESASIGVLVEADPSAFVAALRPPEGWTVAEPRMNSAGAEGFRLNIELRRAAEAAR